MRRVRPGRISEGRRKIKKLKLKASGLEVIRKAVALEKEKTAQKFVIRFRDTRLDVLPYRRPGTLYTIKGIEKGGSTQATGKPRPVTQIVAKGRIRSGEKTRKVEETVRSVGAIKRFGKVEKEKDYGRVEHPAPISASRPSATSPRRSNSNGRPASPSPASPSWRKARR